jgi:hypothetical protein
MYSVNKLWSDASDVDFLQTLLSMQRDQQELQINKYII